MTKSKKSRLKGVGLFLCLTIFVLGLTCSYPVFASKQPYKVGAIFAITGGASFLGEPERNTARMIEEMINARGGINGHPLQLIIEDTAGDETKTVNAVKKLIYRDNVLAIVGPSRSGTTMAIIPIVEKEGVLLISCAAAEAIVSPVKKWVFKTPQKDSDAVRKIYEYMNKKGISRIAIITGTTGFGDQGRKQLKQLAPEYGISIVADETYGPKDTDMTAQLTRIKATPAQAVVNWSIVPAQSIVPKNMRQLGMKIPLLQSHGFGNIMYVELAGEAAEGIIFPAGRLLAVDTLPDDHPQKEVLARYKKEYEARFKENVSTFGGHAWDALWLVINALEETGPRPEAMRTNIEHTKEFVGTGGIFNFSPQDHNGLTKEAFEMLTVKRGKFVVLGES
ncbi:branched-chain amino acid ABC transporter substrate-binding protein [Candidatus Aerophobetes bacterium]|uniref:Branched-chain amino acid ABC transporter substrate-binding protein n=1 Tax=Aerophobetes bacterium TaxID=2030807 RepID=A0A662DJ30_UNCAE|nr:MAG: branched-chain amino acid ABC transporter substrate-binding protein [Candidatus Aerophobetes bacterium]